MIRLRTALLLLAGAVPLYAGDALTVGPEGDFPTLQAAVDAAPAGATITVAPGLYRGRVRIDKTLTILGAGPDQTILEATWESGWVPPAERRAQYERDMRAAPDDATRRRITAAFRADPEAPSLILVVGARDVRLQGLRLRYPGERLEGSLSPGAIVTVRDGSLHLAGCALLDSPGGGLAVRDGGRADVEGCLFAALGNTGITVGEWGRPSAAAARIARCEIRDCHYAGVVIRRGCDGVTLEACRISGAQWHGIAYTDASPVLRANRIFDNARTGIYASGTTAATVTGNLFERNGLSGISCWYRNHDHVVGNTFREDPAAALSILGASAPLVERNLVVDGKVGVRWGSIGEKGPDTESAGEGTVRDNLFLRVETPAEGGDLPAGNRTDGEADGQGAGAVPPEEPYWPVQREEKEPVTTVKPMEQPKPAPTPRPQPRERAKPPPPDPNAVARQWIADICQIEDAGRRDAALERVREALKSDDPSLQHAGVIAILRTADVAYDKASFRPLVLPLVTRLEGAAQVTAFYALANTERQPQDRQLLLNAAHNPSPDLVRRLSNLLFVYGDGVIDGEGARIVVQLLSRPDPHEVREVLRGLWGARVAPEVEARLLELWREPRLRSDVNYFALSTLQEKSHAVCDALFEAAQESDWNISERALSGLSYGVQAEEQRRVADFALKLFAARDAVPVRFKCLHILGKYGGPQHVQAIEEIANNRMLAPELRGEARQIAARLRPR